MKISELIAELQKHDPDREVIMARDAEGNGYSPLADMWAGSYLAETTWYGKAGMEAITDADRKQGFTDADIVKGVPAVILCPVN